MKYLGGQQSGTAKAALAGVARYAHLARVSRSLCSLKFLLAVVNARDSCSSGGVAKAQAANPTFHSDRGNQPLSRVKIVFHNLGAASFATLHVRYAHSCPSQRIRIPVEVAG